ncbi:TRIC cation channel family protein [Glutamicibacter sp. MNS18]|uniref:trimeric intracellular cation channel family protein n=1 Tax=Glutamicibacter sp. MNS18 TaxID=2989817 RepID=UPI002236C0A6|nr:TRIC cation channel family protein [Glutamicibacter sp. MNS18]MCW4467092.1 TRIC cation channel family protein [Glutamicibacter sp. MNS18]
MFLLIELVGIFFFAVSGSLVAARRGFDIIGSMFLAGVAGLGGGVVRDLILDQTPATFTNPVYFVPAVLGALLVYFFTPAVQKLHRLILLFDAGGLGLFCVTGTLKALTFGMNPITAVLLGVTTAVGGGLLRDVISNVTPELFNPRDIYALPAIAGAAIVSLLWVLGWFNPVTGVAVAVVVFLARLASLKYGWKVPMAAGHWHREPPAPGSDGPQRHY